MIKISKKQKILVPVLVVLALIVISACAPSVQSNKKQTKDPQTTKIFLPPEGQGIYEACAPLISESACLDRLNRIAAGGFKLVLNYDVLYGTAKQEITYASRAQALGMKVIWAINNPEFWNGSDARKTYTDLAAKCHCTSNTGFVRYIINLVKDLPATWGYYVGDEVDPSNHHQLKVFTDLVRQVDPSHPRLFVGSAELPPVERGRLVPFVDTTDVLGVDYYPVGRTDIPKALEATGKIASTAQAIADQYHRQVVIVLQAHSLGEYPDNTYLCNPFPGCLPFPTRDQMRLMRDLVLKNAHPEFILWYSYFDILKSHNPSAQWAALVEAATGNSL